MIVTVALSVFLLILLRLLELLRFSIFSNFFNALKDDLLGDRSTLCSSLFPVSAKRCVKGDSLKVPTTCFLMNRATTRMDNGLETARIYYSVHESMPLRSSFKILRNDVASSPTAEDLDHDRP